MSDPTDVVTGVPRLTNGGIDWAMAVQAAVQHAPLCQQAAQDRLAELVSQTVANEGIPGSMLDDTRRGDVLRRVRASHPDLTRAADSGEVNEAALRQLFWQYK